MKLAASVLFLFAISCQAQSAPAVSIFHAFPRVHGGFPQGEGPSQPIEGVGGNLIGVTNVGGSVRGDCGAHGLNGCGTVYLLNSQGNRKALFNFPASGNDPYGAYPIGPLVQGRDSQFYGVTQSGPAHFGFGTIFKVNASGQLQTLHVFCQQPLCADGAVPFGSLIRGTDGFFYGTTNGAGSGAAVIYRIAPGGAFKILVTLPLHRFGLDRPVGNLLQASDGNFYGLASLGGTHQVGGIFRVTPDGQFTNFYDFGRSPQDGAFPTGSLIQADDGNLYGATSRGGVHGIGTIFRIGLSGAYATILDFSAAAGAVPSAGPMQASDGNLWGTTSQGGSMGNGNIYEITFSGALLNSIALDCSVGVLPSEAFTQAMNGKLYTGIGGCLSGSNGGGAVIEVDTGLPAPKPSIAAFTPASGTVGTTVVVSGAYFVSASAVAFKGTPATFVVNAAGVITATVPAGASSGPIQVTGPGGQAISSSSFTVAP